ncbi:unnamed protein product, partial [Rotaria sp. Silwood1]
VLLSIQDKVSHRHPSTAKQPIEHQINQLTINTSTNTIDNTLIQSLNSTISVCNNTNKRQNFTNQTNTLFQSDKIVIVSHFNESLDWLNLLDDEQIPYIVYTRLPKPLAHHRKIRINKGRDPAAYLRYIVDHYSNLPLSVAFVHGHRTSYHQENPSDIVTALRALQWHKYNYMPLSTILAHPTIFYSNILDYIMYTNYSDYYTGRSLEYTWHIIFGEPTHINYPTCDIFVCDSKGNIIVPMTKKKIQ